MKYSFIPKSNLEKIGLNIYKLLVENFPQTFFVGGTVRDMLLGKKITDIDIATGARPKEVIALLAKHALQPAFAYPNLGSVIYLLDKNEVAITTLRRELYTKGRYPLVKFTKSPRQDSQRRDFTINSLYFSLKLNKIFDFHGGLKDIKNKQIRFIGRPGKRVFEDPLRMLRALRFASDLKFKIEKKSGEAVKENHGLLKKLTKTRMEKEILKAKTKATQNILKKFLDNPHVLDKFIIYS